MVEGRHGLACRKHTEQGWVMLARKELFDAPQSQFDQYYIRYIYVIMLFFLSFRDVALRYLAFLLPAQPS